MVSFSVYPSWHLMRQAALDPAKSAKYRKARLISWMTRGPRKTCNDWSIGLTPTKRPKTLTDSLQGDGKKRYTANRSFFVRSPTRRNFPFEILGGWGAYVLPTPEERSDAVRVANFRAERSARVDQVRAHTTRTNSPYQQHLNLHRGRGPPPEVRPDNTRLQIT